MEAPGGRYIRAGAAAVAALSAFVVAPTASAAVSDFRGISGDGAEIWFTTADQLVTTDTDSSTDVYERSGGQTRLVSGGNAALSATFEGASANGSQVFFSTLESLAGTDDDSSRDIYVRQNNTTLVHVSRGTSDDGAFNVDFNFASADGTKVVFETDEAMAAGDDDTVRQDVYRRDLTLATTTLLSEPEAGHTPPNDELDATFRRASTDASRVFFTTTERLTASDSDSATDIFRATGSDTRHVSVLGDGSFGTTLCGITDDGGAAFYTTAEALTADDDDSSADLYVRAIGAAPGTGFTFGGSAGRDGAFSVSCGGNAGALNSVSNQISATFTSREAFPGSTDSNGSDRDVIGFRVDFDTGAFVDFTLGSGTYFYFTGAGDGHDSSLNRDLDSSAVVYSTTGEDLVAASDGGCTSSSGFCNDVFLQRSLDSKRLVSTGAFSLNAANDAAFNSSSDDGEQVMFSTKERLSSGDNDDATDVYVRNLPVGESGTTTHVSAGAIAGDGAFDATSGGTNAQGTHHAFETSEKLANTDLDSERDVYVLNGGTTSLVSLEGIPPQTTITAGPSGTTSDSTPTFDFTSNETPGTFSCRLTAGSTGSGSFSACNSGSFTSAPLADGPYFFEVRATDAAGNTDPSPATRSFTVDTSVPDTDPPQTTITGGPDAPTQDTTPTWTFTSDEGGSTFSCRFTAGATGSGPFTACNSGSFSPPGPLADGGYFFEVKARDAALNEDPSPATRKVLIDTDPPQTTITSPPHGSIGDRTPTFVYSADEADATFVCELTRVGVGTTPVDCEAGGSFDPDATTGAVTLSELAPDDYVFSVVSTDAALNEDASADTEAFTVVEDDDPPETTITSSPHGLTNDSTPTFTFSGTEPNGSFICDLAFDEGFTGVTCDDVLSSGGATTGSTTLAALEPGEYMLFVRAVDQFGNADLSPAAETFTVDPVPPDTRITAGPRRVVTLKEGKTRKRVKLRFESADEDATFRCKVDRKPFKPCTSPFRRKLREGRHKIKVQAVDQAGNRDRTPAVRRIRVKPSS